MISILRRLKLSYILYNIFNRNALKHNVASFKKYGLSKYYFSPLSSRDFSQVKLNEQQHIITQDSEFLQSATYNKLNDVSKASISNYNDTGYVILRNYFIEDEIEAVNTDIKDLLEQRKIKFKYGNKLMFVLKQSEAIRKLGREKDLNKILDFLMNGKAELFQSINFIKGSEQASHSDSIHMTTFPLGGLLGVWIALEDIGVDQGPVHYYPGSHKLPYYLNADYDNEGNFLMIGNKSYSAYEDMMRQKIDELNLNKEVFTARKGDVLIWHANLFHGGEPHQDKSKTRKSLVFHYFKKGVICYHEISQRPALINSYE